MNNKNDYKSIEDLVFDFIYEESMNDATRRTDAASSKSNIMKIEEIKTVVRDYAEQIINGIDENKGSKFEISKKYFMQCTDSILEAIAKAKKRGKPACCFTFGNAQKLVNMIMKRLYIRHYGTDRATGFKYCFCPMDMRMRDKIAKEYKKVFEKTVEYDCQCAWSKMDKQGKNKYDIENFWLFQKAIDDLLGDKKYMDYKNRLEMDYRLFTESE